VINPFKVYRGLPRDIYYLFLVQVINRFGDFVVPFLSLYLTARLELSPETAGLIVTLAVFLQVPGSIVGGKFGDHFGRKSTYMTAQTLAGLAILMCAFTGSKTLIIGLLCLSAFFNAVVKPSLSTLAFDLLPPEERKRGGSLIYLGINAGVALGPMVAGFLFNHNLLLFFGGDALTSLIVVAIVSVYVKEVKQADDGARRASLPKIRVGEELRKNPGIIMFFLLMPLFGFVYEQAVFSLPLTVKALFPEEGPVYFGYIMSINAVAVLALTSWLTERTRHIPLLANIAAAGFFYAVGFGMVGFIHSFAMFAVSTIIWTIGEILTATNMNVYVVNNSPEATRARYNAILIMMLLIGKTMAPLCMGRFIQSCGIQAAWLLIILLSLTGSFLMYGLYLHTVKRENCGRCADKL
jgi:MFS family permease